MADEWGLSNATHAELQEAATLARAWLLINDVKVYGLIEGGPTIDIDRCKDVLVFAAERGIVPTLEEAQSMATLLLVRDASDE